MDTQFLTDDGRQRAIAQLEFLRTVKRAEVAQYLHEAKESGDVIDNAAYEDAKNEQARLEGRIMELEQLLATARPISKQLTHEVSLGSIAHLRTPDGREYHYTIVGAFEAKPAAGLISNESPVGRALLGHRVGDMVMVSTPGGVKEYTIYDIE
jgi:transcription elongation factor GreA